MPDDQAKRPALTPAQQKLHDDANKIQAEAARLMTQQMDAEEAEQKRHDEREAREKEKDRQQLRGIGKIMRRASWILIVDLLFTAAAAASGAFIYSIVHETHGANQLLIDCTTPSTPGHPHPCSDQGVRATADAIHRLSVNQANVVIASNECLLAIPRAQFTYPLFESCVQQRIVQLTPTTTTTTTPKKK